MTTTQRPRAAVVEPPAPEVVRISTGELERQLPIPIPPVSFEPPDTDAPVPGAGVPAVFMDAPVLPALPSLEEIAADLVPRQRSAPPDEVVPEPRTAPRLESRPVPRTESKSVPWAKSRLVSVLMAAEPRKSLVVLVVSASAVAGMLFAGVLL
jgi:hypothetical protein